MIDEPEGIFYYLRVIYSSPTHVQLMEEQEERQFLSLTYKKATSSRRNSIKSVAVILESSEGRPMTRQTEFLGKLRREFQEISLDLIHLIEDSLLPVSDLPETRLFYEKLKADYYRYICESDKQSTDFQNYSELATASYEIALEIGRNDFASTSLNFLGLALNYSVFVY
jgi:14-3-3 protein epsilon